MSQFRISKLSVRTPRSRNPVTRRLALAEAITSLGHEAMVSCTECARHGAACFFDQERSTRCAECIRHQRTCDGSFSLEEFRKIGEQKKQVEADLLKKERMIAEARRRLVELEEDGVRTKEWLQHLNEVSGRMLSREMRALGVLSPQPDDQKIALGNQSPFLHSVPDPTDVDLADLFFSSDPQWFLDSVGQGPSSQGTLPISFCGCLLFC